MLENNNATKEELAEQKEVAEWLFARVGIHPETLQAPQFQGTFTAWPEAQLGAHGYSDQVVFRGKCADNTNPKHAHRETIDDRGCWPAADGRPIYGESLWSSNAPTESQLQRIIVVPRAIDALAHHQLKPDPHALYLSFGNTAYLSPEQKGLLQNELNKLPKGGELILAAGHGQVRDSVAKDLQDACLPTVTFATDRPQGLSWANQVQQQERAWISSRDQQPLPLELSHRLIIAERIDSLKAMSPPEPNTNYLDIRDEQDPLTAVAAAVDRYKPAEIVTRLPDTAAGRQLTKTIRDSILSQYRPVRSVHHDLPLRHFKSWEHALAAQNGIKPETVDRHDELQRVYRSGDITKVIFADTKLDALAYQQLHPDACTPTTVYFDINGGWHEPRTVARDSKTLENAARNCADTVSNSLRDVQKNNLTHENARHPDRQNPDLPALTIVCAFESSTLGRARHQAVAQQTDRQFFSVKTIEKDSPTLGKTWIDVIRKRERDFVREASKMLQDNGLKLSKHALELGR